MRLRLSHLITVIVIAGTLQLGQPVSADAVSVNALAAALEANGYAVQIGIKPVTHASLSIDGTAMTAKKDDQSVRLELFVYVNHEAMQEDWTFTSGATPVPKRQAVEPGGSAWNPASTFLSDSDSVLIIDSRSATNAAIVGAVAEVFRSAAPATPHASETGKGERSKRWKRLAVVDRNRGTRRRRCGVARRGAVASPVNDLTVLLAGHVWAASRRLRP